MAAVKTLLFADHPIETTMVTELPPKISAAALLSATKAEKQQLYDIHELITRLYVRNRNQHRRSHWFKSLCMFRKQLGMLIAEMDGERKGSARDMIERRLIYWDQKCIHQWYLTFTQLVAAGQFAVIGLVLMACTARICRIVGITEVYEEIAREEMKEVLEVVDEGKAVDAFGGLIAEYEEDEGEVIERE